MTGPVRSGLARGPGLRSGPPPEPGLLPALTGDEAAAWDRRAIEQAGVPERVLMENAGRALALVVDRLYPHGAVVAVVGAGNNGGDALVALRTLAAWGREVRAILVADRPADDPLLHAWPLDVERDDALGPDGVVGHLARAGVVLDGVLGTGVRGAPRPRQAEAVRAMNGCGRPVVALDVPSGIDPATGAVPGDAVRATVTVAFGAAKVGALFPPARAHAGRLVVVEIGFPPIRPDEARAFVATPRWARSQLAPRSTDTHKNAVGRVTVVGGGVGMAGAVVLAARGALRAGAGLVRVCTVPENRAVVQSALPEAIWVDATDAAAVRSAVGASDALVAGPGLGTGEGARSALLAALGGTDAVPAVLDADALNLGARGAFDLTAIGRARPLLLTPHPGEMARLDAGAGASEAEGEESRPAEHGSPEHAPRQGGPAAVARAAAARFGGAVLLKGAPSAVADPAGTLLVDTQGSSDLATAGLGDTLAGVCGALLARGLPPLRAGAVALYLTGRAARLAGLGVSLTPSDVLERLPDALTEPVPAGPGDRRGAPAMPSLGDLPFVLYDAPAPW